VTTLAPSIRRCACGCGTILRSTNDDPDGYCSPCRARIGWPEERKQVQNRQWRRGELAREVLSHLPGPGEGSISTADLLALVDAQYEVLLKTLTRLRSKGLVRRRGKAMPGSGGYRWARRAA
jgi:hypothetical protein